MFSKTFSSWLARGFCIVLLCNPMQSAFSQEKKIVPSGRTTVFEEIVTTTVIHKNKGLFSSSEEPVEVSAVLWTPEDKMGFKKPYPLVVYSHGGHSTGADIQVQPFGPAAFFLSQGIAVYAPIRKGFSRKGSPSSTFSADKSEPIDCRNFRSMDDGVASAKQDTAELVAKLKTRPDIDLDKVVLMGQSRGGFLSLALAADGMPGVIGVLNFSGGWHSEACQQSYNQTKFSEFGGKMKVSALSFYGDSDSYFGPEYTSRYIKSLAKNGISEGTILTGYSHVRPIGDTSVWGERAMLLFKNTEK